MKSKYIGRIVDTIARVCDMISLGLMVHDLTDGDKTAINEALNRAKALLVDKKPVKYEKQYVLSPVDPCTGCHVRGCKKPDLCDGFVYVEMK